ncbi:hypothetical protein F511_32518 [Dorcoceras hygrometricum]|uniref:Uncharacterized protein n=1 Tax=Dorcoceras hygrometricum TaxID=472368 RepID=A0A2Z7D3R1_9LAMI|nr:hypothetical protein F511_32518 [Dorcoceras hygrometricum]
MCVPAVAVGINWSSSASLDFSRCVLISSSSNADVDFSRWCISAYPAVANVNMGQVPVAWGSDVVVLLKRSVLGISCWSPKTITVEVSVALFYPAAGFVDQLLTARMTCPYATSFG